MGGSIVAARAKGANDMERVRAAIGQSATLSLIIASIITAFLYLFSTPLIAGLYPNAEQAVIDEAVSYMKAYSLSLPPYAVFCVFFSCFRSLGDAKSSLILTIVINAVHLIGSYIFINLLGLSALGSALSFLAARVIGMAFSLVWLFLKRVNLSMKIRHFFVFDRKTVRDIALLGVPFTFEQLLFQGGMLLVQRYLTSLPTSALAAHSIASSLFNLYYAFAYALTAITGAVCGQCVGAGRIELARTYAKRFVFIGRWILLASLIVIMPLTPLIMNLYSPAQEMRSAIMIALAIGAIPMPLLWCDGYILPAATRTAGDATFTSVISLLALFAGRLALGYLFTIPMGLGIWGVWIGQAAEWIIRSVTMRTRIRGDSWIKQT